MPICLHYANHFKIYINKDKIPIRFGATYSNIWRKSFSVIGLIAPQRCQNACTQSDRTNWSCDLSLINRLYGKDRIKVSLANNVESKGFQQLRVWWHSGLRKYHNCARFDISQPASLILSFISWSEHTCSAFARSQESNAQVTYRSAWTCR